MHILAVYLLFFCYLIYKLSFEFERLYGCKVDALYILIFYGLFSQILPFISFSIKIKLTPFVEKKEKKSKNYIKIYYLKLKNIFKNILKA